MFPAEQQGRNRSISSFGGPGGVVIAPADMGVDCQIIGMALQGQVVQPQVFLGDGLQGSGPVLAPIPIFRIAEHAPGAVIELHIPAAGIVQVADHLAIGGGNVLDQLFMVRIHCIGDPAVVAPVQFRQQLGRCRQGLAGQGIFILELLHVLEMFHKGMVLATDPAGDDGRAFGGLFSVEKVTMVQFDVGDALEPPEKVQVPVAATEFPIGEGMQPGGLLLFDQSGNFLVFHLLQIQRSDLPFGELFPGLFQPGRTQKAANNIETERCTQCHLYLLQ